MRKLLSLSLVIGLLCGALAAYGPATASARGSQNALTHTEYKQLTKSIGGIRQLFQKGGNLNKAYQDCKADGNSTALMKSEYGACSSLVRMFDEAGALDVAVNRCKTVAGVTTTTTTTTTTVTTTTTSTGTTTTPTTTTSTGTTTTPTTTTPTTTTGTTTTPTTTDGFTQAQLVDAACMNYDYQSLSRAVHTMYLDYALNHRRSVQRGFKGNCLSSLSGQPRLLVDEQRYDASTKSIATNFAELTQIDHGQTPAHIPTLKGLSAIAVTYEVNAVEFTKDVPPANKLASCPHS